MQKFTHPTYEIRHACGCVKVKQVLEATENKRKAAAKAMSEKKCIDCLRVGK